MGAAERLIDALRTELAHMANDAGANSCAEFAVENERLRKKLDAAMVLLDKAWAALDHTAEEQLVGDIYEVIEPLDGDA